MHKSPGGKSYEPQHTGVAKIEAEWDEILQPKYAFPGSAGTRHAFPNHLK